MDISTAATALSVITSVQSISAHNNDNSPPQETQSTGGESQTVQKLDQLIEIQDKNQPTTGDKDAFSSATVSLDPGETVEVAVEPADGYNLRVRRIHFDRKSAHAYRINVGGDVTSVSHRAKYASPKLVSQSDRVLAKATNNSGSTTVIDFEMEAWAEKP